MELSILLVQIFGLYFLIVGVSLLINHKKLRRVFDDIEDHYFVVFTMGLFVLLLGLLLVLNHNIWEGEIWVIIVTIISWLTFLKGVAIVLLPISSFNKIVKNINNDNFYRIAALSSMILGIYLTYIGFSIVM